MTEPKALVLPTRKLKPNDWNPNRLDDDQLARLERSLSKRGFVMPVIVFRPKRKQADGRLARDPFYTIIDGEHRWRLSQKLRIPKIPCVLLKVSEKVARELTINLNYLRGEPDWASYAKMLDQFVKEGIYTEEQLSDVFPVTDVEVNELLASVDGELQDANTKLEREAKEQSRILNDDRVYTMELGPFTKAEFNEIQEILDSLPGEDSDKFLRLLRKGHKLLLKKKGQAA